MQRKNARRGRRNGRFLPQNPKLNGRALRRPCRNGDAAAGTARHVEVRVSADRAGAEQQDAARRQAARREAASAARPLDEASEDAEAPLAAWAHPDAAAPHGEPARRLGAARREARRSGPAGPAARSLGRAVHWAHLPYGARPSRPVERQLELSGLCGLLGLEARALIRSHSPGGAGASRRAARL